MAAVAPAGRLLCGSSVVLWPPEKASLNKAELFIEPVKFPVGTGTVGTIYIILFSFVVIKFLMQ